MTLIQLESPAAKDEELVSETRDEIRLLRKTLSAFREQIERGEGIEASAISAEVRRATGLIDTCRTVENRIEELRRKQAGVGPCGYAIDFDAARDSLRCKLNRIRNCGDTGKVS